jgi:uncharacterized protein with HEPN domain
MTTTVTITLDGFCASQGHVAVNVAVEGQATKRLVYEVPEIRDNLGWDDAHRIVRDLLRMHFRGMTLVQARNSLIAGVTVEI